MADRIGRTLLDRALCPVVVVTALTVLGVLVAPAGAVQPPLPGPIAGWSTTTGTDGRVFIADD